MSKIQKTLLTIWILIWSIPLNLFAIIVSLGLLILGCKPQKWGPALWFQKGHNWGGLEMGLCCFMTDDKTTYHTKCHEVGHLLQQAIFGPLMPFIVSFPSASRYWLFVFKTQKSRYIYGILLTIILLLITITLMVLGVMFGISWIFIISILLTAYVLLLCGWLIFKEIPKFTSSKTRPKYDDFIIEEDATKRGTAFIKKYYPDLK